MTAGLRELVAARVRVLADERSRASAEAAVPSLVSFLELLLARAASVNLLSKSALEPAELVARHLGDALEGLQFLPPASRGALRLLDIGTGGGFPAVPILLCRSDMEGVLVESVGKKAKFLEDAAAALGLTADVSNARFPGPIPSMKNHFHVLTSRAVADAGGLAREARSALTPGARALLWTTEGLAGEAARAARGFHSGGFHRTAGSEKRGILVLERST